MSTKPLQDSSKPESQQKPEGSSVYENLNLHEMNAGEDNYQSLQGNSDNNEVSCENSDSTLN